MVKQSILTTLVLACSIFGTQQVHSMDRFFTGTSIFFAEKLSDIVKNDDPRLIGLVAASAVLAAGGVYVMAKSLYPTVLPDDRNESALNNSLTMVTRTLKFGAGGLMTVGGILLITQSKNAPGLSDMIGYKGVGTMQ